MEDGSEPLVKDRGEYVEGIQTTSMPVEWEQRKFLNAFNIQCVQNEMKETIQNKIYRINRGY